MFCKTLEFSKGGLFCKIFEVREEWLILLFQSPKSYKTGHSYKISHPRFKNKGRKQGQASGTGSPRSRGPGPGNLYPGLEILKSGIGTGTQICGTRNSGTQLFRTVPGTENFPGHGPGPVPTPGEQLRFKNLFLELWLREIVLFLVDFDNKVIIMWKLVKSETVYLLVCGAGAIITRKLWTLTTLPAAITFR